MKNYIITIFALSSLLIVSCDDEIKDPTRPSVEEVFSNRAGLIGVANGLQAKWSLGRQSPVYAIVTANGFTTNELRLLNAGNVGEGQLLSGGTALVPTNDVITNLWSQSLIVYSESQKVIDNLDVLIEPKERVNVYTHASIFKALALGTLIQFFEKVPLQTIKNAPFNTRAEVLAEAINILKLTLPTIADATGFPSLVDTIKYKNTVYALLSRYYMMSGDNTNALVYANLVDLSILDITKNSTFSYDAVSVNPIAFNATLTTNNYQPINLAFGLPASLAPISSDKRINFYIKPFSSTNASLVGNGFCDSNIKKIPFYLPGEIILIKAEAYARMNMLPEAIIELDKILTKTPSMDAFGVAAGLTAYTGPIVQDDILNEIYRNRCIELYMMGLKLEDSRRFGRPGAGATGAERNRNYYPYPAIERINNTNTPANPAL